ncbi:hypothetical protein NC99_21640 [Sunxiuqinia dokdonensis]|uniref:Uncharacterized protein n=1 Tax=Sunxiuqinia dokdonensis TaxID=1409788 RepID=A0A0L8V9C1_9BACT|nr:hypothetical protein NC99_21640 [Sunxiuqinia dokdonensis]
MSSRKYLFRRVSVLSNSLGDSDPAADGRNDALVVGDE